MDTRDWVIAVVYVVMSAMLVVVGMLLLYAGQAEMAKGTLTFLGVYMVGMPLMYGVYRGTCG